MLPSVHPPDRPTDPTIDRPTVRPNIAHVCTNVRPSDCSSVRTSVRPTVCCPPTRLSDRPPVRPSARETDQPTPRATASTPNPPSACCPSSTGSTDRAFTKPTDRHARQLSVIPSFRPTVQPASRCPVVRPFVHPAVLGRWRTSHGLLLADILHLFPRHFNASAVHVEKGPLSSSIFFGMCPPRDVLAILLSGSVALGGVMPFPVCHARARSGSPSNLIQMSCFLSSSFALVGNVSICFSCCPVFLRHVALFLGPFLSRAALTPTRCLPLSISFGRCGLQRAVCRLLGVTFLCFMCVCSSV